MVNRCEWANQSEIEQAYHDTQWGKESHDDTFLFEMLVLEMMQAGLSWRTILNKRENFRRALDGFDYQKISQYDTQKRQALLNDSGIVRNRLKIEAVINNAARFIEIQKEYGSFATFLWGYVNNKPLVSYYTTTAEFPSYTALSAKISGDLKKRGFSFVGPTIIYSYLQSVGVLNDHIESCDFKYPLGYNEGTFR